MREKKNLGQPLNIVEKRNTRGRKEVEMSGERPLVTSLTAMLSALEIVTVTEACDRGLGGPSVCRVFRPSCFKAVEKIQTIDMPKSPQTGRLFYFLLKLKPRRSWLSTQKPNIYSFGSFEYASKPSSLSGSCIGNQG